MEDQPYCSYFLFINSGSGGGVGQKMIQQREAEKISFEISLQSQSNTKNLETTNKKQKIDVYFYNLKANRQKGFNVLKSLTKINFNTKVIVCGGDGTVVWVVSQLNKYNIDTQKTPLAIIPLGTGNDFSQYLGWGKMKTSLTQKSFSSLKKLIRKWENAKIQEFDIWDVKAQIYEHGKFQKVQQFKNKLIEGRVFERSFCNYFSFGMDGKIGYSFDMHRTKSRLGNLAVYGAMGMLKSLTKTKTLNDLIHGMQIRHQLSNDFIQPQGKIQEPLQNIKTINKQTIDTTKQQQKSIVRQKIKNEDSSFIFKTQIKQKVDNKMKQKLTNEIQLKHDFYNIVALNINSFMGGVFQIWKNAKNAFSNDQSKYFTDMDSGDGKLEFIGFASSVGMAAQRTFGGFAQKIHQGQGPFYFNFKQYDPKQKHRTYLQIDGQFIRFSHPKSVMIRKSTLGKNGKIRVLRNIQQS